eukprot:1055099-Prorocentrum_lima.AAC.1
MTSSLVGSEMCIRDSPFIAVTGNGVIESLCLRGLHFLPDNFGPVAPTGPVSYTHLTLPTICSV